MENKSNRKLLGWRPKGEREAKIMEAIHLHTAWFTRESDYYNATKPIYQEAIELLCDPIEEPEPEKWEVRLVPRVRGKDTPCLALGERELFGPFSLEEFDAMVPKLNSSPKGPVTAEKSFWIFEQDDNGPYITNGHIWLRDLRKIREYLNSDGFQGPVTLTDEEIVSQWRRMPEYSKEGLVALVRWARGEDQL
jgi:hypothetical protein